MILNIIAITDLIHCRSVKCFMSENSFGQHCDHSNMLDIVCQEADGRMLTANQLNKHTSK